MAHGRSHGKGQKQRRHQGGSGLSLSTMTIMV
jgi:hypothetical protein